MKKIDRCPGEPPKKIETLREHMGRSEWREALKLAASFARLGDEKVAITRAWEASTRPDFCRQLGKDPERLIADGVEALKRRYGAPTL